MSSERDIVESWRKSTASITGKIAYCLARRRMKSADLLSWIEELQGVLDGMRRYHEQFVQAQAEKGKSQLVGQGEKDAGSRTKGS